jgi:hypothetical protein
LSGQSGALKKLLWFAALWLAGVVTVAVAAYVIRLGLA